MRASRVLAQYQHMPSFSGIHSDCQSIVARLKTDLKKRLDDPNVSILSSPLYILREGIIWGEHNSPTILSTESSVYNLGILI